MILVENVTKGRLGWRRSYPKKLRMLPKVDWTGVGVTQQNLRMLPKVDWGGVGVTQKNLRMLPKVDWDGVGVTQLFENVTKGRLGWRRSYPTGFQDFGTKGLQPR